MTDAIDEALRPSVLGPELAAALGDPAWRDLDAELIAGGKSNLTFRLSAAGTELILRRPPLGDLLPRAHDMGRERRILDALAPTPVPVPAVLHFGGEGNALGVDYYVMEVVPGVIVRDALPDGFAETPREREALAAGLVDTLAALHAVDPEAVGLDGFGRPDGYFARQLARWSGQSARSDAGDEPALDALRTALESRLPAASAAGPARIVHGDYRIDNCVIDAADPGRVSGVLDWELSTLGDPLADLGLLLFSWREPGEEPWRLAPAPTRANGFPGRAWLIERYAGRTGADVSSIGFAHAFAHFKFAAITQGVAARVRAGTMAGQDFGDLTGEVSRIAEAGLSALSNS
ncbi:aminoglycoside phosphotransferase (APT) family kinase protein [Microbacterium resistens]|uniref:Aminoglycoside phosphotransferase (APT) family kinase protein n=1 Tax=Microbacterium resistens TaxID=156977 RepID=A0ABU1SFI2_9MICO|nr:phosphotransferase family protein [Microbacterium resistens]MDR6868360.1 aminoglycoside phosphotransferase (APT) family kinase protein [Microbacterium resistens]